jgi:hypothetical protein
MLIRSVWMTGHCGRGQVRVWGWAAPGEAVEATLGGEAWTPTTAGGDGRGP